MLKRICSVAAVMATADRALAQSGQAVMMLSHDGVTWSSQLDTWEGQTVRCGVFVSVQDAYGFAGFRTSEIRVIGALQSDVAAFPPDTAVDGRYSPFTFGSATNAIFQTSYGYRVDALSDPLGTRTNVGAFFGQSPPTSAPPGTYADASQARLAFAIQLTIGGGHAMNDAIAVNFGELEHTFFSVHLASDSTRPTVLNTRYSTSNAMMRVVPTPGGLALLGWAGILSRRMRRG